MGSGQGQAPQLAVRVFDWPPSPTEGFGLMTVIRLIPVASAAASAAATSQLLWRFLDLLNMLVVIPKSATFALRVSLE